MPTKPKFIKTILIITIVIFVVTMGVLFILNETKKEMDRAVNWDTYANKKYGYSIEYPIGWEIDTKRSDEIVIGDIPWEPSPGPFDVVVYENKNFDFIDNFKDTFEDNCSAIKNIILNKMASKEIVCYGAFAGEDIENYFLEKNNHLYRLSWIKGSKKLDPVFNQVLYSFKFIPPQYSEAKETESWKTYQNKKYKIELKYPDRLNLNARPESNENSIILDENNFILNIHPVKFVLDWDVKNVCYESGVGNTKILEKININGAIMPLCIDDSQKEVVLIYKTLIPKDKDQKMSTVGNYFSAEAQVYGDFNIESRLNMFKQILATIKFLE